MKDLVSIIIPTRNSAGMLVNCLRSIKNQSYKNIEIIIVDGKSTDNVFELAKKYKCKIYSYIPKIRSGSFDASYKRNYGAKKAKGDYIYWMDADMRLPKDLIGEAVKLCKAEVDALVLPEDSYGEGIWAKAKNLERRCYWGDDTIESPRFFTKIAWRSIGGFDVSLGAGGDDMDLRQKLMEKGFVIDRTKAIVMHNEGHLTLKKLSIKHFMYGKDTIRYFRKRPKASVISYFPIRKGYLMHVDLFLRRPLDTFVFLVMRTTEYFAGFLGLLSGLKNQPMDIEEYAKCLPQYYVRELPQTLGKYVKQAKWETLLDVGCGDGPLLFALKEFGYLKNKKILATDLSRSRIHLVRKIDPTIHAFVDNAEKLSKVKTSSVDFVLSKHVIEHVDDRKMLAALARVAKKGATLYIATVFKKWYGWYYYRKDGKWTMDLTHLREYGNDKELLDLIDKKKFKILETKKDLLYFPVVDFFIRRLFTHNREMFADNSLFLFLRSLKIPIPGYYNWEIVLKRL